MQVAASQIIDRSPRQANLSRADDSGAGGNYLKLQGVS